MLPRIAFVLVGLLFAVALTEAGLRLFPVATGYFYQPVNAQSPVLRGTPNASYTYSLGWNFREVSHGVLNNDGFISNQSYGPSADGTVLLIGDSYVQAAAVPEDHNLHAELSRELQPVRVFGLSRAGGALPDYLAMARWGRDRYHPRALAFLIVSGDVDDSVNPKPGGYYFKETGSSYAQTRFDRNEHRPAQKALNRSMLFRYLYDNLAFTVNFPKTVPPPDISLRGDPARLARYDRTCTFFLDELERIAPREQVLLLIHRSRKAKSFLYDADVDMLADAARKRGIRVLDLGPFLTNYEARTGIRLDSFPVDTHWNQLAQKVVAGEVAPILRDMMHECPGS